MYNISIEKFEKNVKKNNTSPLTSKVIENQKKNILTKNPELKKKLQQEPSMDNTEHDNDNEETKSENDDEK